MHKTLWGKLLNSLERQWSRPEQMETHPLSWIGWLYDIKMLILLKWISKWKAIPMRHSKAYWIREGDYQSFWRINKYTRVA